MVDKCLYNSQDSLGLIDTSELFKGNIEENILVEIMNSTENPDSEEFGYVNIVESENVIKDFNETAELTITPPTGDLPSREDFTGPYGFELLFTHNRGSYVYSPLLKQVFIKMNNILMMEFKTTVDIGAGFYIRALMMYACNDFVCEPVIRCVSHALEEDPLREAHARGREHICKCKDYNYVGHVMRCSLADAEYCYDSHSERHSVRVPVSRKQAGTEFIQVPYSFSCKNSCSRGMQRRPVLVVFTLENEEGGVVGRKVLPIKICSCPKRDKDRQESDFKKAQVIQNCPSSSKRVSSSSLAEFLQPPVKNIKTEENFDNTQSEEEKPKHKNDVPRLNSPNPEQDINQRLLAKMDTIQTVLYRIENAERRNSEKIDRIEDFLTELMQYRP